MGLPKGRRSLDEVGLLKLLVTALAGRDLDAETTEHHGRSKQGAVATHRGCCHEDKYNQSSTIRSGSMLIFFCL